MPVLGIEHYNLHADRALLVALRDFYCDVVGLLDGPRPQFRQPGYWLYAAGRPIVHLTEAAAGEVRVAHVATTFDHMALACSDLEGMVARLDAAKVSYRRAQVPATGVVQLFLSDPAGNGVELNFS